jgi:NAD-dependent dihydropyrimidine dehydrogenase PreA subunit/bacterioferritin-associated ferredoxin
VKVVRQGIEVVDENCTGCFRCERVCPTEAIVMVGPKTEALAVVDNDKCIACMRCIDSCDDDALLTFERDEEILITHEFGDLDPGAVEKLCRDAGLAPTQMVCFCTITLAQEVAGAILHGATTFEEVAMQTGVQSGCLIYCSVPIRRLLKVATGEATSNAKFRRYPQELALPDVPLEIADRYPIYNIRKEQEYRRTENTVTELQI